MRVASVTWREEAVEVSDDGSERGALQRLVVHAAVDHTGQFGPFGSRKLVLVFVEQQLLHDTQEHKLTSTNVRRRWTDALTGSVVPWIRRTPRADVLRHSRSPTAWCRNSTCLLPNSGSCCPSRTREEPTGYDPPELQTEDTDNNSFQLSEEEEFSKLVDSVSVLYKLDSFSKPHERGFAHILWAAP